MWDGSGMGDNSFNQGGGFMNSDVGASPAQEKKRRAQNVVPVCIRQILESPEDGLVIHGFEVHMIELIGLILNVEQVTTKISYTIADSTGRIEAIQWITEQDEDVVQVMENTYCRIVGQLRSHQGKRNVMVLNISSLKTLNHLTTHLLEVMFTSPKLKQLQQKQDEVAGSSDRGTTAYGGMNGNSSFNQDQFGGMSTNVAGLNTTQAAVYQCISGVKDSNGIHKDQILKILKGRHSNKDIADAWDFLSSEGHIYTTIDEDYFKSTDG